MKTLSTCLLVVVCLIQNLPAANRTQAYSKTPRAVGSALNTNSETQPVARDYSDGKAALSEQVSVSAGGRGRPWLKLADGHDLLTNYSGDFKLTSTLNGGNAIPLSVASADLDEDGVPDLLEAFGASGRGIISVYRGNVDALY
ncbi:MAG TPA: hypothetical protein VLZ81_11000, partial [Blastocatellia bacterium]|nr:hypothetical protein [Blastocatellia bacterium]